MLNKVSLSALSLSLAAGASTFFVGYDTAFASSTTDFAPQSSISTVTQGPVDSTFQSSEANIGGSLISGNAWRGYLRQMGRDITVTLPSMESIQSISIELEQNPGLGVYFPNHVDFEVMYNGQWTKVGTAHTLIPTTDKRTTTQTFSVKLNHIHTQQVRLRFPVSVWVFARHLHINGTAPTDVGGVPNPNVPQDPAQFTQPLSPNDSRAHGIKNMLLVYTGDHGTSGLWTQSDFMPMLGYTSLTSSSPTAHMFDTMLFLPYGSVADSQSSWQSYLNDLFTPNQQLSALDAAVGQMNQQLGTPGYKEKVVLTLPYAAFGDGTWGYVNGTAVNLNGTSSDPNALQARHQAMQWYLQTMLSLWNSANFQNLQLTGLYWENEAVNEERPGEVSLIKDAVSLSHQNNLPLFWIPFYDANGIADWQTLGFDAAWLQPNFIEQGSNADVQRIHSAEQYATSHGLGLELEATTTDAQSQTLYAQTIDQLAADGFGGNVSHAYYAGSKVLVTAANSYDLNTRLLYDNTFNMISHP